MTATLIIRISDPADPQAVAVVEIDKPTVEEAEAAWFYTYSLLAASLGPNTLNVTHEIVTKDAQP